jgi:hypothetical protein
MVINISQRKMRSNTRKNFERRGVIKVQNSKAEKAEAESILPASGHFKGVDARHKAGHDGSGSIWHLKAS